ncbi:MAG: hypothetical protein HZB67_00115, partial [Candidatus Aenigmarchaeota archaeon]|nr:hypothetical protein [Candidatus Aenigmarchaeota archaeon]
MDESHEFIIVVVAALVLLGVFLLVFGQQYYLPPAQPTTSITTVAEVAVGQVGFVSTVPAKIVQIKPFSAGTTQFELLKDWGTQEISAALGSKEISEVVAPNKNLQDYIEKLILEFDVNKEKTSAEEDLVVVWNSGEVFRGKPAEGHQAVRIPKGNFTDSNALRIYTTPPGLASIVKASAYGLENLKLTQEYGQAKVEVLDLPAKDYEAFERAEINFASTPRGDTTGTLTIKVNGQEIYKQKPDRFVLVDFDQKKVPNLGPTNRISFLAEGGLYEITDPKINVYLLTTSLTKKKSFALSTDQLKNLEKKR